MDSRLIKPKALLLKDYLMDDMSSCSSNGFKSFPRRQCCTSTVRFLLEIDHKNNNNKKTSYLNFDKNKPEAIPRLSRSKSAISALQSVIAAVKRLPFTSASSTENKNHLKKKSVFLPRSLSVKFLKKSGFWKRKSSQKEIGRWKSFDQLLKEDPEPSDISVSFSPTTTMAGSDGRKRSLSGNDFTACTSRNSPPSKVNMDLPNQVKNDAVESLKNGDVSLDSTSNSSDCSNASTTDSSTKQKQWSVNKDKEQSSPVSVMDFPFDDDEEVSSPYQHGLVRMEGTQKKVMKKIMQRFGSLEPLSLAKQFESTGHVEDDQQDQDSDDDVEKQALSLLDQMNSTLQVPPSGLKIKADKLLIDFFREKIIARDAHAHSQRGHCCGGDDRELLEEAGNWMNERKPSELFLDWEVSENREAYVKDMDKTKEWKLYDEEGYKELGAEVLDALFNELLLDISS